jgi:SNW domain-containing protein 1
LYDQRLFNQSKGLGSGFDGGDDAYNIYDKPMFANTSASSIYRPRGGDNEMYGDEELEKLRKSRFTADKGFQGADASAARDGPVQFEKEDDDVFGLDKFFTEAKKGKQAMDSVGKGSTLAAGASSSAAHLRDGGGTKRDRLDFEAGKGDRDAKRGRY